MKQHQSRHHSLSDEMRFLAQRTLGNKIRQAEYAGFVTQRVTATMNRITLRVMNWRLQTDGTAFF